VHIEHSRKYRKRLPARCGYCKKDFFHLLTGRPPTYCSSTCRTADFRFPRHLRARCNETPLVSHGKHKRKNGIFADRGSPFNAIGGHRWVGRQIEPDLLHFIVDTEVQERRRSIAPTPELVAEIPADLSIPAFLKRTS
jgi:hypothetical protein